MSSTNKTTNYELSQFIGTDKPAWLTDYNSDMGKIDAGVHTAQTTATGADGKATANATAIGTLSSLTTDAKTSLVAAVNEVDTHADAAANAAATAAGNATQALNKANALADYLALTPTAVPTNKIISATGTFDGAPNVTVAVNSTNSLGKVYGDIHFKPTATGLQTITLNIDSGIHPDTAFTINPAGVYNVTNGSLNQMINGLEMRFNPNGTIDIMFWPNNNMVNNVFYLYLWPCLYFFTDFGDLPSES